MAQLGGGSWTAKMLSLIEAGGLQNGLNFRSRVDINYFSLWPKLKNWVLKLLLCVKLNLRLKIIFAN